MSAKSYYYAAGKRVDLHPASGFFAVDTDSRQLASALSPRERNLLTKRGRALKGGVRLYSARDLPEAIISRVKDDLALPVFRHGSTLIIVLPEVRVEHDGPKQTSALRQFLRKRKALAAEIVQEQDGQIVLRPSSGRGADALALANEISEALSPPLSQARFVRVVQKPNTTR